MVKQSHHALIWRLSLAPPAERQGRFSNAEFCPSSVCLSVKVEGGGGSRGQSQKRFSNLFAFWHGASWGWHISHLKVIFLAKRPSSSEICYCLNTSYWGQYLWNWFQIYYRYRVTVSEAKLRYTAVAYYLVRIQHLALLYTTNHNIQGKIWLLGWSRHNFWPLLPFWCHFQPNWCIGKLGSHTLVSGPLQIVPVPEHFVFVPQHFVSVPPTLLKSVRFAAQRGSDPLKFTY